MADLDWVLGQALEGIHHEDIKRIERHLVIGGLDYEAVIYAVPPKVIRIDLQLLPQVERTARKEISNG